MRVRPLGTALLLMAMGGVAARAQTIHVPVDQPTVQAAINAASDGTTVVVAPGTYYENVDFLGKEVTLTSSGGAANTVIDGSRGSTWAININLDAGKHSSVIYPAAVDGFTIRNGGVEPSTKATGGIFILGGTISITNNVLTHNHCTGIYNDFTPALIQGNEIDNTLDNGGDCFVGGGSAILITTTFNGCANCNLLTRIVGNTIQNNVQGGQEGPGSGGITNLTLPTTIQFNTLRGNATAAQGGAIYQSNDGATVVADNLIVSNVAACGGGAIATARVVSGYNSFILANNTLADNAIAGTCKSGTAGIGSQVLFAEQGTTFYPTLMVNNIVSSTAGGAALIACARASGTPAGRFSTQIFDHNLFYNAGQAAFDTSCADPGNLYGNQTANPQFGGGGYVPLAASPAIDSGNTSEIYYELQDVLQGINTSVDLAGNPRVVDARGNGFAVVDMGAYELAGTNDQQATALTLQPNGSQSDVATVYSAAGGASTNLVATAVCAAGGSMGAQGPVTFYENGNVTGTANLTAYTGKATLQNVLLTPGLQHFTASYPGQGACFPGVSIQILYVVSNYAPQVTLTSSVNPVQQGQPVTFTVTIASADPAQGGPIALTDGSVLLATLTPNAQGVASFVTSSLALGSHAIAASYAGDATHNAASAGLTEYVVSGSIATMTAVSSSENPSVVGDTVTFYANVTSGSGPPTGTVSFADGATVLSTQALVGGNAQFSTSSLGMGAHAIAVSYSPTGLYAASAGSLVQVVTPVQAAQTITFPQPMSPAYVGTSVTLGAAASSGLAVTYTVLSGPGTLNGAVLTYTGVGTVVVEADQAGNTAYSSAAPVQRTVTVVAGDFSVTATPASITIETEHHGTLGIGVTSIGGFAGTVQLACGALPPYVTYELGSASLTVAGNGSASTSLTLDTDAVLDFKSSLDWRAQGTAVLALLLPLPLLLRRRRRVQRLLVGCLLAMIAAGLSACGDRYPGHTPPGTYVIPVSATGTSGTGAGTSHVLGITLVVTP